MTNVTVTTRRGIQSVEIAFRILSALQTSERALPLKEIAALSDLSPSATSNYMISLVRTGLASALHRCVTDVAAPCF